jgi:hypothetical protein
MKTLLREEETVINRTVSGIEDFGGKSKKTKK